MPIPIVNSQIYYGNPYHNLLYSGIGDRYEAVHGDIDFAIGQLNERGRAIFHVHWEEHPLRRSPTRAEAKRTRKYITARARHFVRHGGKIVWTIHNAMPHELQYPDIFLDFRRHLSGLACKILVHNVEAATVLNDQVVLDARKLHFLPHPSYLDVYEPAGSADLAEPPPNPRTLLTFGKIRRYKGFGALLDMLPPAFMAEHGLDLQFTGEPLQQDRFAEELQIRAAGRTDVRFDFRRVEDDEVPALLRGAAGVLLPYERFLTSGVAVLNLSLGALTIAPDVSQMRDLFPPDVHFLLFEPGDVRDFQRAVLELIRLTPTDRAALARAYLDRANSLHPIGISRQLGAIYDQILR